MYYGIAVSFVFILIGVNVFLSKHIGVWGHRFDLTCNNSYYLVSLFFVVLGLYVFYMSIKRKIR